MRYRRTLIPGGSYFFTVNLAERKSTLLVDEIELLKLAFSEVKARYPFKLDAIVILPDHLHTLMTLPDGESDYSLRWSLIKAYFSRQLKVTERISQSRQKKRKRGIWQRRFWEHMIRNEYDYEQHVNYIHYNSVKHGYVEKPVNWKYSSIHKYVAHGILSSNWAGSDMDGKFGE